MQGNKDQVDSSGCIWSFANENIYAFGKGTKPSFVKCAVIALWQVIWKERNSAFFKTMRQEDSNCLWDRILSRGSLWPVTKEFQDTHSSSRVLKIK